MEELTKPWENYCYKSGTHQLCHCGRMARIKDVVAVVLTVFKDEAFMQSLSQISDQLVSSGIQQIDVTSIQISNWLLIYY